MKTAKIDLQVDSILKVTKSVIQSSDNYNKYYIQNDDSLYSNQLPLLTSLNRSNSLIYENSKSTCVKKAKTQKNMIKTETKKNYFKRSSISKKNFNEYY